MATFKEKILILAKTYPSPSAKYVETSCVAGITAEGAPIRIFPVPFRLIEDDRQFSKWQWINAVVEKSPADHRRESHRIYVDTIERQGDPLPTGNEWVLRRPWLDQFPTFSSVAALDRAREEQGVTLGIICPKRLLGLDIEKEDNADWTEEEKEKLAQEQMQLGLFTDKTSEKLHELRKLPHRFYYRYVCDTADGEQEYRHKISDWEAGALYWQCQHRYGNEWETKFRAKLENDLPAKDLQFLMGNIHRFPAQWLIVSLIYPPKQLGSLPLF